MSISLAHVLLTGCRQENRPIYSVDSSLRSAKADNLYVCIDLLIDYYFTCLFLLTCNTSLTDPGGKSVPAAVERIAYAVTHARFVGTDQASDGVVLMKIIQVGFVFCNLKLSKHYVTE